MSLLFDQNLSWRLAAEYPGCQQVIAAGLSRADDRAVWAYAASAGLAIVSKDRDFVDLATSIGPPPKVIFLRVGNCPTREIEMLLRTRRADVMAFLADFSIALLELP